jgi:hypothetical protein
VEGFLIKDRSDEFVDVIKKIKNNHQLWQRMSHAARQKIKDHFSIEACSDQWIALFQELSATVGKKTELVIPPLQELKKIVLDKEFYKQNNPRPASVLVPLYKAKYFLGRMKRNLLKAKA